MAGELEDVYKRQHLNDRKIIIYIEKEIDACYDKNSENCLKI